MTIFMPIFNQIREKKISISVFIRGIFDPFLWRAFFWAMRKKSKKGLCTSPVAILFDRQEQKLWFYHQWFPRSRGGCVIFRVGPYIPITTVYIYIIMLFCNVQCSNAMQCRQTCPVVQLINNWQCSNVAVIVRCRTADTPINIYMFLSIHSTHYT